MLSERAQRGKGSLCLRCPGGAACGCESQAVWSKIANLAKQERWQGCQGNLSREEPKGRRRDAMRGLPAQKGFAVAGITEETEKVKKRMSLFKILEMSEASPEYPRC